MESEMKSHRLARQLSAVAGGLAIVAMVGLTASCAKEEEKAPETTTTTTTTTTTPAPPVSPTEKAPRIDPGQPNPFSPTVHAPPAPTAVPGDH
jgi:type IV secretory pathway VirB10-like protein